MKGWMHTRHVQPPEQDGVDGTLLNSCFHLKDRCSHWKWELLVWNSRVKMERAETSMTLVSASSELDTLCASLTVSFSKLLLFSRSVMCYTFVTPWTVACQAPLSVEFSRQEYWSGLPFPSSGNISNPGIKPMFPAFSKWYSGFFTTEPPGKTILKITQSKC